MINKSHSAFTPQTPSLFVIASPLQLLCALEAIYEFKIEEYKIVFPYIEGKIRYQQVEKMFVSYNLVYDKKIVTVSNSFVSKQFIRSLLSLKNYTYKRIFIGDIFSQNPPVPFSKNETFSFTKRNVLFLSMPW